MFRAGWLLPRGRMLTVLNKWLDWIAIDLSWSPRPWSILQQELSHTKLPESLLPRSIPPSTFCIHCTNLFFACQLSPFLKS